MTDPALRRCCPSTRGIYFDFICVMHQTDSGGVLTGSSEELIALLGRCLPGDLSRALIELKQQNAADVSKRGEVWTIVCRRMKREAELSVDRATAGSKGAAKRKQTADYDCASVIAGEAWMQEQCFQEAWARWQEHRKQIGKPATALAMVQQLRNLKTWGKYRSLRAINHSIANGYQGLFEPRTFGRNGYDKAKETPVHDLGSRQCSAEQEPPKMSLEAGKVVAEHIKKWRLGAT